MPREKMREKPGAVWGWVGLGWGGGVSGREREGRALWRAARAAPPAGERERKKGGQKKEKINATAHVGGDQGARGKGGRRAVLPPVRLVQGVHGGGGGGQAVAGGGAGHLRGRERRGEARGGVSGVLKGRRAQPRSLSPSSPPSQPLTPATMVASCSKPPTREATPDTLDCEWGGGGGREWRVGA